MLYCLLYQYSVVMFWNLYYIVMIVFFFKQKTAYEMRMSDLSSDGCSSDLSVQTLAAGLHRWVADRPAEVWHEQQAGNARNHESRPPVNDLSDQSTCQRANGHPEGCGEIEQGNGAAALIGRVIVRNQRERWRRATGFAEAHTQPTQEKLRAGLHHAAGRGAGAPYA